MRLRFPSEPLDETNLSVLEPWKINFSRVLRILLARWIQMTQVSSTCAKLTYGWKSVHFHCQGFVSGWRELGFDGWLTYVVIEKFDTIVGEFEISCDVSNEKLLGPDIHRHFLEIPALSWSKELLAMLFLVWFSNHDNCFSKRSNFLYFVWAPLSYSSSKVQCRFWFFFHSC